MKRRFCPCGPHHPSPSSHPLSPSAASRRGGLGAPPLAAPSPLLHTHRSVLPGRTKTLPAAAPRQQTRRGAAWRPDAARRLPVDSPIAADAASSASRGAPVGRAAARPPFTLRQALPSRCFAAPRRIRQRRAPPRPAVLPEALVPRPRFMLAGRRRCRPCFAPRGRRLGHGSPPPPPGHAAIGRRCRHTAYRRPRDHRGGILLAGRPPQPGAGGARCPGHCSVFGERNDR